MGGGGAEGGCLLISPSLAGAYLADLKCLNLSEYSIFFRLLTRWKVHHSEQVHHYTGQGDAYSFHKEKSQLQLDEVTN